MKGRITPTAGLVVLTAVISAGFAGYRSGSNPGTGQPEEADLPIVTLPGMQEESSGRVFARPDDLSKVPISEGNSNRSLEDDIRELRDTVTALSRAVAALERDRREYAAEDRGSVDEQVDAAPGAEQPSDFLAQQFEAELTDAGWAARTEPLISDVFRAGDFPSSQLIYHSCKATVCRIEIDHDDAVAAENFMFQLLPQVSDEFTTVATQLFDDAYGLRSVVLLGNAH
jgi:hypothetical protein